jgi:two-component system CheB/CheR fusion protein
LRFAAISPPDVILLDLAMPGMDGWTLARQVRASAQARRPLLIAISGYGRREDMRNSHEAGIDLHLVKPVDSTTLGMILRRFQTLLRPEAPEP